MSLRYFFFSSTRRHTNCALETGVQTCALPIFTVAPAQTLTDKEYQILRDASLAVLREIGVETGGSNVQFGICPNTGRMVVIEMNPRVSRSSALSSQATGFPIAQIGRASCRDRVCQYV